MADAKKPFHEAVAEKLIEQLKQGTAPWQRPWEPGEPSSMFPTNPTTGKRYKGINAMFLMAQGHSDQRWMTYKQAAAAGAQVRKGERGTPIQYWKFADEQAKRDAQGRPVLDATGEPMIERVQLERPKVFFATVFNAEQIDGLPPLERREQERTWTAVERAEAILAASGAAIKHASQNTAFYRPSTDSIHMPEKSQFPTADNYYATALHELGHWTGHSSRLARDLSHPFGSEGYAKEELRAEIASMILGDELGIGHDPGQHAAYVNSWIKALENDPMEIIRAAADAEKIQGFVMSLEQVNQQQQEQVQARAPEPLEDVMEAALHPPLTEEWVLHHMHGDEFARVIAEAAVPRLHAIEHILDGMVPLNTQNEFWTRHELPYDLEPLEANIANALARIDARHGQLEDLAAALPAPVPMHTLPGRTMVYTDAPGQAGAEIVNADGSRLSLGADAIQRFAAENDLAMDEVRTLLEFDALADPHRTKLDRPEVFATTEGRAGRLYDRLAEAGLGWGDARVAGAWRDLHAGSDASHVGDAQEFREVSRGAFGFALPEDWSGRIQVQGNVMAGNTVAPADLAADQVPEFYGVYAQRTDGTHVHLQDLPTLEAAEGLAERLRLVDAHAEINKADQLAKLAAIKEASVRRDPNSTDEQREAAKEDRKAAEFAAWQADPAAVARGDELERQQQEMADYINSITITTTGELDDLDVTGANIPEEELQALLESHSTLRVTNQDGVALDLMFDMDQETLVAAVPDSLEQKHTPAVRPADPELNAAERAAGWRTPAEVDAARDRMRAAEKTYIAVPFKEKNAAKELGAKWDRQEQSWYIPAGVDAAPFSKWAKASPEQAQEPRATLTQADGAPLPKNVSKGRQYLAVPYEDRLAAKAAGAQWDKVVKSWYVGPGADPAKLRQWAPEKVAAQQEPAMHPRDEFAEAMRGLGLVVEGDHPHMDGKTHRVPVEGGKKGATDGFYVLYPDGHPAGRIINNKTGADEKWSSKGYALNDEQKAALRAEAAANLARREETQAAQHENAAVRVSRQLDSLRPVEAPTPYIEAKGIQIHPGAFTDRDNKTTYIPAIDADNKLWSMQYIQEDGTKRFAKESRKEGCFHAVGGLAELAKAPVLVVAEGYATAATLAETLGHSTAAAFDSGNLLAVATALHAKFPDKPIIIAGDDDRSLEQTHGVNAGRVKAEEAAKAVGGVAMLPIFAPHETRYPAELQPVTPEQFRAHLRQQPGEPPAISAAQLAGLDKMKAFTDFNDLATKSELGREGVARQVQAVVAGLPARAVGQRQEQEQEHLVQTKQQRPDAEAPEPRRQKRAVKM